MLGLREPTVRTSKERIFEELEQYDSRDEYQEALDLIEILEAKADLTDEERRLINYQEEVDRQTNYMEQYNADVAREGPSPNVSTGAEQSLYNAQSRLEAARRNVTSQRNRVQQAREKLANTPPMIEEPVYSIHTYNVTQHIRTGILQIKGKLIHYDGRDTVPVAFQTGSPRRRWTAHR